MDFRFPCNCTEYLLILVLSSIVHRSPHRRQPFCASSDLEFAMARSHVPHLPKIPVRPGQISLPELLPRLRQALESQRDFRVEQLAQFDAVKELMSRAPRLSPAVEEVQAMVVAGARRALSDIEIALARIQTGSYGRCRECGNDISTSVLVAIPMTTLCLACQRQDECITYGRWSGRPLTPRARHKKGPTSAGQGDRVDRPAITRRAIVARRTGSLIDSRPESHAER
jgi:DnaK suppressor protein